MKYKTKKEKFQFTDWLNEKDLEKKKQRNSESKTGSEIGNCESGEQNIYSCDTLSIVTEKTYKNINETGFKTEIV